MEDAKPEKATEDQVAEETEPPIEADKMSDKKSSNIFLWPILVVVAIAIIILLVFLRKAKKRGNEDF